MKNNIKNLVAIVVPSILLAPSVFAGLTTTLELTTGYRDSSSVGGEFTAVVTGGNNFLSGYSSKATAVTTVNGKNVTGFQTFCVEFSQTMTPNTAYNTSVGTAIQTGANSSQAVTLGTAYLYSQFAQGILQNYNYTPGSSRDLSADELQDAIWYLQGDIGSTYKGGNYSFNANGTGSAADPFLTLVESVFGSLTKAKGSDASNNYGVYVLNLTTGSGNNCSYAQDQLVYCPVPEPATLAAGAMLLLPLGWSAYRSLRKNQK